MSDYSDGLLLVDVSNPEIPELLGHFETDGYVVDSFLSKSEQVIFLADFHEGFKIVDISNRNNPTELASYPTDGWVEKITISKNEKIVSRSKRFVLATLLAARAKFQAKSYFG